MTDTVDVLQYLRSIYLRLPSVYPPCTYSPPSNYLTRMPEFADVENFAFFE